MNYKIIGGVVVFVLIVSLGYVYWSMSQKQMAEQAMMAESASPTPAMMNDDTGGKPTCAASDLEAALMLEGAAGTIRGPISLTNVSGKDCQLPSDATVKVLYPDSITNLEIMLEPTTPIDLSPEQGTMAMISYPNGPQCGQGVVGTTVNFMVKVGGEDVPYAESSSPEVEMQICKDVNEMTTVKISGFFVN